MALIVSVLLTVPQGWAGERDVVRTGWAGLQQRLGGRQNGVRVRVGVTGGERFAATLREVREDGLAVDRSRATAQWRRPDGQTLIPKQSVATLTVAGKRGKGRLYGTLIGLGAGAAAGAGIALGSREVTEGAYVIVRPVLAAVLAGLGALIGYFVGGIGDRVETEYVLTP